MENDADGLEGAKAAKMFFADHRVNAMVVIAHQRGNCHAYNAGWSMALSAYPGLQAIAVIDDDELAAPDWLDNLVSVHRQTRADLIGGRSCPISRTRPAMTASGTRSSCPIMMRRVRSPFSTRPAMC